MLPAANAATCSPPVAVADVQLVAQVRDDEPGRRLQVREPGEQRVGQPGQTVALKRHPEIGDTDRSQQVLGGAGSARARAQRSSAYSGTSTVVAVVEAHAPAPLDPAGLADDEALRARGRRPRGAPGWSPRARRRRSRSIRWLPTASCNAAPRPEIAVIRRSASRSAATAAGDRGGRQAAVADHQRGLVARAASR